MIIGHSFVLTFQERRSGTFDPIRQRLRKEKGRRCDARALITWPIHCSTRWSTDISASSNDWATSARISRRKSSGGRRKTCCRRCTNWKREASILRRTVWPMRELIGSLQRNHANFFSEETRLYLRDIYDHTVHLLEQLEDLRDLLTGLLDVT